MTSVWCSSKLAVLFSVACLLQLGSAEFDCGIHNCVIPDWFVNDGFCDCKDCSDESEFSCQTCPGCPQVCDNFVQCSNESDADPITTISAVDFQCSDGCAIDGSYVNDNWCDCVDCGDEDTFTCDLCGGCPDQCGDFFECNDFECRDGCVIPEAYVDDHWCDCSECEDESALSCQSCPGCPDSCGAYIFCVGTTTTTLMTTTLTTTTLYTTTTPEPTTTIQTTTTFLGFHCKGGCEIRASKVNDGNCDCIDCGDEDSFTCDSCPGGCPEACGLSTVCTTTTAFDATNAATTRYPFAVFWKFAAALLLSIFI